MMGGILAGFVTSFITAAVELSATILLATSESQAPLSYGIYLYNQSIATRGPAAALGVIAIVIVALGMYVSQRLLERRAGGDEDHRGHRMTDEMPRATGVGIEIEGVNLAYGANVVLRDISLSIAPGEFFALLGPSGSGKSTLLRLLAGFNRANAGRVRIAGIDVAALPPWQRDVGMVFQNYALWPHLTVGQNVAFGLEERRWPRERIRARVRDVLDLVSLAGYDDRRPGQLSGGQQQRVAIARTLAIEPRVLLLDEPLSNLDAKLRASTGLELKRLQRRLGITTVFVTHDQQEAMTIADRLAVLDQGVIQQVGTPRELYDAPVNRFVAEFVGSINLYAGQSQAGAAGMSTVEVDGLGRVALAGRACRRHRGGRRRKSGGRVSSARGAARRAGAGRGARLRCRSRHDGIPRRVRPPRAHRRRAARRCRPAPRALRRGADTGGARAFRRRARRNPGARRMNAPQSMASRWALGVLAALFFALWFGTLETRGLVLARRRPLCRGGARNGRQRRLRHAAPERPQVFREAAAAILGLRRRVSDLRA